MFFISVIFFVGSINAVQWVRDDDSYRIYFAWSQGRPVIGLPGGSFFIHGTEIILTAARTSRAFNVYAKNGSPDAETGAKIKDHNAWPYWYWHGHGQGWDTPDADPSYQCAAGPYQCGAPYYLLTIDTYQGKWWLFYSQYPNQPSTAGVANLYVPMSGKTRKIKFNDDGTIDIDLEEDHGAWKILWEWGVENVKLQDKKFVVHLDPATQTGYMVPKMLS